MNNFKKIFAISIGKIIGSLSNLFGSGRGAAAPGLVALNIYPNLIRDLVKNVNKQKIIISATNGKTTTAAMIRSIIEKNNNSYISNQTGSNLMRGIASTLISESNISGNFEVDYAIFEVDEAVLSYAIEQIKPEIVVLGNIFRDQLDRYGEIDTILAKWKNALQQASGKMKLILNADDPGIAGLRNGLKQETVFYGIQGERVKIDNTLEHAADSINCPNCNKELQYSVRQFSHLGDYKCDKCGFSRPKIDITATNIVTKAGETEFNCNNTKIKMHIEGVYNVYNALAAISVAQILDISGKNISDALESVRPAFGRMETFKLNNQKFKIILIKNPTGANAVIGTLKNVCDKHIIVALNDKIADGTDVSWIYDVDWEKLGSTEKIVCLGTRKYDLALRLKYAGIDEKNIKIGDEYFSEIDKMTKHKTNDYVYILPTYTAMMELRGELEKRKIVEKI